MSKNGKRTVLLFGGFVAIVASLPAQDSSIRSPDTSSTWTLTTSTLSQYAFRGVSRGGASLQPSLEYDAGALGLGLWSDVSLQDKVAGQSNPEFDFYGYYAVNLTNSVSLVPGFTVFTYPRAERRAGFYPVTIEPNISVNYTILGVRLAPKLYYDLVRKGPTAELTAAFAVPLKDWGTELDFNATTGTYLWKEAIADRNPAVKNWGDYYVAGVSLPYQVSKNSRVQIGWAYTTGSRNFFKPGIAGKTRNAATIGRGGVTLSYSVTF